MIRPNLLATVTLVVGVGFRSALGIGIGLACLDGPLDFASRFVVEQWITFPAAAVPR